MSETVHNVTTLPETLPKRSLAKIAVRTTLVAVAATVIAGVCVKLSQNQDTEETVVNVETPSA